MKTTLLQQLNISDDSMAALLAPLNIYVTLPIVTVKAGVSIPAKLSNSLQKPQEGESNLRLRFIQNLVQP